MGIRSLRKHLRPYGEPTILSDSSTDITGDRLSRRDVVIDGPCLAHFIYRKLLALQQRDNPARNERSFDTVPSYAAINAATLAFLDKLERRGLRIEKIFFDGYLDEWKIPTREQRLADSARELRVCWERNKEGFRVKRGDELEDERKVDVRRFLERRFDVLMQQGTMVPPPPFLVPSVLEGLRGSRYEGVTEMVAGEAEAYCARHVQRNGGIVLSNDSDCLLYDIGDRGTVVFLDDVSLVSQDGSDASQTTTLNAPLFRPGIIAKRLGVPSLLDIAYILEDHPTWKFSRILQVIRTREANIKSDFHSIVMSSQLAQPYSGDLDSRESSLFNEESLRRFKAHANVLDPRFAEFVLDLAHKKTDDVATYYTVPLFEDPMQTSAREVGAQQRRLAYLILARACLPEDVGEKTFQEKSQKVNKLQSTMWTMSTAEIDSEMQRLAQVLRTFLDRAYRHLSTEVENKISAPSYWRALGMMGVHTCGKQGADDDIAQVDRDDLEPCLSDCSRSSDWSWENIHKFAQIDAFLYSLRMVKQAIEFVSDGSLTGEEGGGRDALEVLRDMLMAMPGIEGLMPSMRACTAE